MSVLIGLPLSLFSLVLPQPAAAADSGAQQVSAGATTACAVVNYKAECWGDNGSGQLGIGTTGGTKTSPIAVATNSSTIPAVTKCSTVFFFTSCNTVTPAIAASALAGKNVTKVSVGTNHACALANATVFCWGDNSHGQLGNKTTTSSSVPVAVNIGSDSALYKKEVVDVSASNQYTCALASDGAVACWGYGANGELGVHDGTGGQTWVKPADAVPSTSQWNCWFYYFEANGDHLMTVLGGGYFWTQNFQLNPGPSDARGCTADYLTPGIIYKGALPQPGYYKAPTYPDHLSPVSIYTGGAFKDKHGTALARASAGTMCVLAVPSSTQAAGTGSPYCWGSGIDDGSMSAPTTTSQVVQCNVYDGASEATTPAYSNPSPARFTYNGSTYTTSGEIDATIQLPDGALPFRKVITGMSLIPGTSTWYWNTFIRTGTTPQTYSFSPLALTTQQHTSANTSWPESNPGPYTIYAMQYPGSYAIPGSSTMLVASDQPVGFSGTFSALDAQDGVVTALGTDSKAYTWGHEGYQGSAVYSNLTDCDAAMSTAYTGIGYTRTTTYVPSGTRTPTLVSGTSLTQSSLSTFAGNALGGLFCAVTTSGGVACDPNGTSMNEGETGSGYVRSCRISGSCDPAPVGPQQVVTSGWPSGKVPTSLSMGNNYTCALVSSVVSCWGVNINGQLGNGTTANKNVPTTVNL